MHSFRCLPSGWHPVCLAVPTLQFSQLEPTSRLLARRLPHDVRHSTAAMQARRTALQRGANVIVRLGAGAKRDHQHVCTAVACAKPIFDVPSVRVLYERRQCLIKTLVYVYAVAHTAAATVDDIHQERICTRTHAGSVVGICDIFIGQESSSPRSGLSRVATKKSGSPCYRLSGVTTLKLSSLHSRLLGVAIIISKQSLEPIVRGRNHFIPGCFRGWLLKSLML